MELDPNAEHVRGLTAEICRTKIEQLDGKLAECDGTGPYDAARIERWMESREFFRRHLRWLLRTARWRESEL